MIPRSHDSTNPRSHDPTIPRSHDLDNTKIRAPLGIVKLVDSFFYNFFLIFHVQKCRNEKIRLYEKSIVLLQLLFVTTASAIRFVRLQKFPASIENPRTSLLVKNKLILNIVRINDKFYTCFTIYVGKINFLQCQPFN
jgi:hypothetical protein